MGVQRSDDRHSGDLVDEVADVFSRMNAPAGGETDGETGDVAVTGGEPEAGPASKPAPSFRITGDARSRRRGPRSAAD